MMHGQRNIKFGNMCMATLHKGDNDIIIIIIIIIIIMIIIILFFCYINEVFSVLCSVELR